MAPCLIRLSGRVWSIFSFEGKKLNNGLIQSQSAIVHLTFFRRKIMAIFAIKYVFDHVFQTFIFYEIL